MRENLTQFFHCNPVAKEFVSSYSFRAHEEGKSLYLFNGKVLFQAYGHLGTIYLDVIDPVGERWGWDASSIVQEHLLSSEIGGYLKKAKSIEDRLLPGCDESVEVELIALLMILKQEFTDLLKGDFTKYAEQFSPMKQDQAAQVRQVVAAINV